jgi:hypothetical protein
VTNIKTKTKKNTSTSSKSTKVSKSAKNVKKITKKAPKQIKETNVKEKKNNRLVTMVKRVNPRISLALIFIFGILLIFSSYAWFSTNLNIKIKTFNLVVSKNSDITISFDGVNFSRSIEITKKTVYEDLGELYPNYNTQWPSNGLIPVSSPGITNPNSHYFDFYQSSGVLYYRRDKDRGFVRTRKNDESRPREFNYYLAFDIFIKNDTGSPESDNLYFETTSKITAPDEDDEEMQGLVNSFRVGIVKVGSVGLNASVNEIQNVSCNNDCKSVIYEPNSKFHTPLSIERAKKYNVNLVDGQDFPTYAFIKEGGPIYVENSISGSSRVDREYFTVQETMTDDETNLPIFTIPNGITKARVYVWIEGQDIDSLETNSKGTDVEITIDFIKDMEGWTSFDE